MKTTSKFNLEKFMNGEIAKTSIGQTARFLAISRGKLIVAFTDLLRTETQETYQLDGRKYKGTSNPFDLVAMA